MRKIPVGGEGSMIVFGRGRHGESRTAALSVIDWLNPPVLIRLLGGFRVLKMGQSVAIPNGGKAEAFLRLMAFRPGFSIPRDRLLDSLWPDSTPVQGGQSLNSLVHTLHRVLGDALGGVGPVLHTGSVYRLNVEAGVSIDIDVFDTLANLGDRCAREGNQSEAASHYRNAIALYQGDLDVGTEVEAVIERERLRAHYLTILVRLAELSFGEGSYAAALDYVLHLLTFDACREDGHRIAMLCHVKLGQRSQAIRQFRLCEHVLRAELDTSPEIATEALFEQIRLHPNSLA